MATEQQHVTDQEIQRIIDQGEAGIGALIAAYEPVERNYFNAIAPLQATTTYSTNTSVAAPR